MHMVSIPPRLELATRRHTTRLSITYGNETILPSAAGFVDTGSTLILIATDAYQKYQSATGATYDSTTDLLSVNSEQYANLKPLRFNIGGKSYGLTPNAQIWPHSLNSAVGGIGSVSGSVVISSVDTHSCSATIAYSTSN